MTTVLTEFARAKVNLFLHVTGRRPDGFHLLDSLAVFPPVGDRLSMTAAPNLSLSINGRFATGLTAAPHNLVLRAARGFGAAMGRAPNFAFRLTKNLPVASGIGGGSADAAAACRLLAHAWACPIPDFLALPLGADVPVCIASQPARMGGIGETLSAAPAMPDFGIVLVNPGVAVSTPAIFKARASPFSSIADLPMSGWPTRAALVRDLARLHNDLETPAIALAPAIATALASLRAHPDCLLARMSGSGATCFGIFPTGDHASRAAASIDRPTWWTWGGHHSGQ